MHVGPAARGLSAGEGARPGRDHGVAQLQHRCLRYLFGETQIPLPRLPRALVSTGGCGERTGGGVARGSARPSVLTRPVALFLQLLVDLLPGAQR